MTTQMLWRPTSNNSKTGNIPQGYVGATRQQTEESCKGCKWRRRNKSGNGGGCYFWNGMAIAALSSMQRRALNHPTDYGLDSAIKNARRAAKYVRAAVGGDPSVFSLATVKSWHDQVRSSGMDGLLIYTHFFRSKGKHLKGYAMASCDTLAQVDQAVNDGWRATVTITDRKAPGSKRQSLQDIPDWNGESYTTPDGKPITICDAQISRTDCNNCGKCDPLQHDPNLIIGFLIH